MISDNLKGILTEQEIRDLKIIKDPNDQKIPDNCYKHASFDFRLDDEYYIPDGEEKISRCSDGLNRLVIPSYTSVIIGTYENVALPDNVAGRFDLRITWAVAGLIFQVGTQIEPGYDGKLFGVLHNLSSSPITIQCKDSKNTLLTAEFHYTSSMTKPSPKQRDHLYKIQDFISKGVIHGSLQGLLDDVKTRSKDVEALSEKLDKRVENELKRINELSEKIQRHNDDILSLREKVVSDKMDWLNKRMSLNSNKLGFYALIVAIITMLYTIYQNSQSLNDGVEKKIYTYENDSLKKRIFKLERVNNDDKQIPDGSKSKNRDSLAIEIAPTHISTIKNNRRSR